MEAQLADYVLARRKQNSDEQQNMVNNVLNAVKTGTDVWSAIQDYKKYQPGSDYMNYQQNSALNWPMKLQMQKDAGQLQYNKDWLDYQNKNPTKPAEQLYSEWLMTPAGQDFKKQQGAPTAAQSAEMQNRLDVANIGAGKGKSERASRLTDQLDKALSNLTTLRPDWVKTDPLTGKATLDIANHREDIKAAVLPYFSDPQDQAWVSGVIDKTLGNQNVPSPGMGEATAPGQPPTDWGKVFENIASTAKNVVIPKYQTSKLTTTSQFAAEKQLESELQSIMPALQGEDKAVAQEAYNESAGPTILGQKKYELLYKVKEALKQKLGPVAPEQSGVYRF